jgi:hypothetical protein
MGAFLFFYHTGILQGFGGKIIPAAVGYATEQHVFLFLRATAVQNLDNHGYPHSR